MKVTPSVQHEQEFAQVAIPRHLLATLIANGIIHGDQCQSLNNIAKQVIWQSLLATCLKSSK